MRTAEVVDCLIVVETRPRYRLDIPRSWTSSLTTWKGLLNLFEPLASSILVGLSARVSPSKIG